MARNSPTLFLKLSGISLMETLLVLTIFALIVVMSIHHYQQYQQETQVATIKNDIDVLTQALRQYFYLVGCDNEGVFPANKRNPTIIDLNLSPSYEARLPLITAYQAQIVDSIDETSDHKPIYLLKINATLNSNLSNAQMNWYQQALNAEPVTATSHDLVWQSLPNNSSAHPLSPYWVLNGASAVFRKIQNGLITTPHSYCAQ